jgi:hypothetical protein
MAPSIRTSYVREARMKLVLSLVAVMFAATTASADEVAVDYIADARLYYRVVACKGTDALPPALDAKAIEKHCAEMAKRYERFSEKYVTPAQAFFATVRPATVPTTIVYPFGGGDLASALVTYPDAKEITTISLEHAGDPTRLAKLLKKGALASSLAAYRAAIYGLLTLNDSTSENMRKLEQGGIPGQLSFHLTGMAALGFEPVSLKFLRLAEDGTIHYLTQADFDALAKKTAKKKKGGWVDTDFSEAYTNMELAFRRAGDPKAPVVTHRHFAWNLADNGFKGSALEKHLLAKGRIAALTKAASFLIWNGGFSGIRSYLLANMDWMASDATGIPPRWSKKAGFEIQTYGAFKGPFLEEAAGTIGEEMVKLWASQPRRKLPFRYGYPDSEMNVHLMITKPVEKK